MYQVTLHRRQLRLNVPVHNYTGLDKKEGGTDETGRGGRVETYRAVATQRSCFISPKYSPIAIRASPLRMCRNRAI